MASRRAGLTLLEVVLAMAVLAVVVGISYAAFHLGMRAVERGEAAAATEQRLRAAADVLVRQIKSAVLYPARTPDEVYPFFVGDAGSMAFVTAAAQQGSGLVRALYRVEAAPSRLVLDETSIFSPESLGADESGAQARASTAVLLEGFRSLRFEYLSNDVAEPGWRTRWDGSVEHALPIAVRIVVAGMPGLEVERWGEKIPIMATAYGAPMDEDDDEGIPEALESVGDDGDAASEP